MNTAPDYPHILTGWLQEQFGADATIIHEASGAPIGMNDCAELFTVSLPSRHLDRLCLITQITGEAKGTFRTPRGPGSLRVRLVNPVDVLDCRGGTARRQFTVHAQVVLQ
ncbi:MAG: hypothetical protein KGJ57_17545 [Sphingomonadales bacterium]|nr:hypothetical protein [Sphingomonadales bacterium]MDE2171203.1 hypothetical protein [Sphingomonadales bacterium]